MCANKLIFDTSALIEMYDGSQKGAAAMKLFLADDSSPFVAVISIAEFASRLKRKAKEPEAQLSIISESAEVLPMTHEIALRAGLLHAQLRAKNDSISLADCIIMAHAEEIGATVVTTDRHFSLFKNSILL